MNKEINLMKAKKADLIKKMNDLNAKANENGDLTEDQEKEFSNMEKELDSLNKRLERAEKLALESRTIAESNMIDVEEKSEPTTLAQAFREAIKQAEESGKKITFNVKKEIEKRIKDVNKDGNATFITTAIPSLIKREDGAPLSIMRTPTTEFIAKTGINVVTSAMGQYPLPRLDQLGLVATSVNADASLNQKNPEVVLVTPTRYAKEFSFQKLALMQSDDKILDGYLAAMQDAPYVTALEVLQDRFAVDASASATTISGTTLSGNDTIKMEGAIPYQKSNAMYLAPYAVGEFLKELASQTSTTSVDGSTGDVVVSTTTNNFKWEGKLDEGTLNGYPAYCHPSVNDDNLIFVDGKVMWIVFQREPEIIIDPYTQASAGNIKFISECYMGAGISDYRGVSYIADVSI